MPRTETLTYLALALAAIALAVALYAIKLAHDLKEMTSRFSLDRIVADVHRAVAPYVNKMPSMDKIDTAALAEGAKKAAMYGAEQVESRDPQLAGMLRRVAGGETGEPDLGGPSPGPFGRQAGWMAPF